MCCSSSIPSVSVGGEVAEQQLPAQGPKVCWCSTPCQLTQYIQIYLYHHTDVKLVIIKFITRITFTVTLTVIVTVSIMNIHYIVRQGAPRLTPVSPTVGLETLLTTEIPQVDPGGHQSDPRVSLKCTQSVSTVTPKAIHRGPRVTPGCTSTVNAEHLPRGDLRVYPE